MGGKKSVKAEKQALQEFKSDKVVRAMLKKQPKRSETVPDDLESSGDSGVATFSFHPNESDRIAIGTLSGTIEMFAVAKKTQAQKLSECRNVHENSVRSIDFTDCGSVMFSASADKSLCVLDCGQECLRTTRTFAGAHKDSLSALTCLDGENLLASGDDSGYVRVWDLRSAENKQRVSVRKNREFISSFMTDSEQRYLVCASGDGSLTTLDLRQMKYLVQSVEYDEEFMCLGLFRNGSKLVAGTSAGICYIFNWHEFGSHSDQFRVGATAASNDSGKKSGRASKKVSMRSPSVNCLVPITEDMFVGGFSDGTLRAVHLFPSRDIGVVGEHDDDVAHIDISAGGSLIASHSIGEPVRFWNIDYFRNGNFLERISRNKNGRQNLPSSNRMKKGKFLAGLKQQQPNASDV